MKSLDHSRPLKSETFSGSSTTQQVSSYFRAQHPNLNETRNQTQHAPSSGQSRPPKMGNHGMDLGKENHLRPLHNQFRNSTSTDRKPSAANKTASQALPNKKLEKTCIVSSETESHTYKFKSQEISTKHHLSQSTQDPHTTTKFFSKGVTSGGECVATLRNWPEPVSNLASMLAKLPVSLFNRKDRQASTETHRLFTPTSQLGTGRAIDIVKALPDSGKREVVSGQAATENSGTGKPEMKGPAVTNSSSVVGAQAKVGGSYTLTGTRYPRWDADGQNGQPTGVRGSTTLPLYREDLLGVPSQYREGDKGFYTCEDFSSDEEVLRHGADKGNIACKVALDALALLPTLPANRC